MSALGGVDESCETVGEFCVHSSGNKLRAEKKDRSVIKLIKQEKGRR